ncbi:hypothetical protein [Streptomyces sp. NPDC002889]|uniref:hypothetical protein n=1 Tax=Streptomyces sp. NPDC002889 TaxID=3364669 RepID=UPI0036B371D6
MRVGSIAVRTAGTAAVLALAMPPAAARAAEGVKPGLSPSPILPGGEVGIRFLPHGGAGILPGPPLMPPRQAGPHQAYENTAAPVPAGGAATAARAAVAEAPAHQKDTGPGLKDAVVGLVLAGVAAVAVALRSTRRRRRTGAE